MADQFVIFNDIPKHNELNKWLEKAVEECKAIEKFLRKQTTTDDPVEISKSLVDTNHRKNILEYQLTNLSTDQKSQITNHLSEISKIRKKAVEYIKLSKYGKDNYDSVFVQSVQFLYDAPVRKAK